MRSRFSLAYAPFGGELRFVTGRRKARAGYPSAPPAPPVRASSGRTLSSKSPRTSRAFVRLKPAFSRKNERNCVPKELAYAMSRRTRVGRSRRVGTGLTNTKLALESAILIRRWKALLGINSGSVFARRALRAALVFLRGPHAAAGRRLAQKIRPPPGR